MRGAEILADYQIRQGYLDGESEKDAPECVFSILALLGGRLEQVRRVIRGEADPERIWGAHNAISRYSISSGRGVRRNIKPVPFRAAMTRNPWPAI